jgi:hypothetical protein
MLYFTLVLGILILICAALTINSAWTQANVWIVLLGVVCVVIGALMEALGFQHARASPRTERAVQVSRPGGLVMPPDLCRCSWRQASLSSWSAMLQAMAFFWN